MTLSRHLYRLDEVRAAMMWCLSRGRAKEGVFWCIELLASGRTMDALYCMVVAWLYGLGAMRLEWYRRAWEVFRKDEVSEESIIQYAWAIAGAVASRPVGEAAKDDSGEEYRTSRDGTVLVLLCGGMPSTGVLKGLRNGIADGWKGLHGRAGADGRLHQLMTALEGVADVVGEEMAEYVKEGMMMMGYLATVVPKEQQGETWRPIVLREVWKEDPEIAEWMKESRGVRRSRRVYQIPQAALVGVTARGRMLESETTEGELMSGLEDVLAASEWWEEAVAVARRGDDEREEFYDREFGYCAVGGGDIPDEWSVADRRKSHGPGASKSQSTVAIAKGWWPVDRSIWGSAVYGEWSRVKEDQVKKVLGI